MSSIEDHVLTIKDLKVYYRTAGDPKNPPLVLLNGWGARLKRFLPFFNNLNSERAIAEFARHNFYVVSPEHPGLMRSQTPQTVWGPEKYVEYLKEFIDQLKLENFILVGQSFGGAIATLFAATYPAELKTLVLISAGLSQDKKFNLVFKRRGYFGWVLRSILIPTIFKKILVAAYLGVPWNEVEKEEYDRRSIMWNIFASWALPNVYTKIRVPTVLIWGRYDMLFPLSSAKEVAREIPHAKLFIVNGGHSVLYTQSRKIIKLFADMLIDGGLLF